MRKDVQLGLAIGGVFLAVLIVWGLVISGSHKTARQGAKLDTAGQSTAQNPSDRGAEVPPPLTHSGNQSPVDRPPAADATDRVTPDHVSTDAIASGAGADSSGADPVKSPSDKKETNWNAIILAQRPEDLPAPLRTATPSLAAVSSVGNAGSGSPGGAPEQTGTAGSQSGSSDPILPPTTVPSDTVGAASPVAAPATLKTHTVQRGESFYTISKAVYGDARFFDQIAKANPTVSPSKLRAGMVINLPDVSKIKADASRAPHNNAGPSNSVSPSSAAPAADSKTEYRVASGDSLYKISVRLYGSGEEVEHLYDLNKAAIGSDKAKLKLGMILKLPAAPTATATASR